MGLETPISEAPTGGEMLTWPQEPGKNDRNEARWVGGDGGMALSVCHSPHHSMVSLVNKRCPLLRHRPFYVISGLYTV